MIALPILLVLIPHLVYDKLGGSLIGVDILQYAQEVEKISNRGNNTEDIFWR
jgi:hypothetical protein